MELFFPNFTYDSRIDGWLLSKLGPTPIINWKFSYMQRMFDNLEAFTMNFGLFFLGTLMILNACKSLVVKAASPTQ